MVGQVVNETVETGPGYAQQVWYDLQTGNQYSAELDNWDLAFEISGFTASIRANCQKGLEVYNAPVAIEDWATITDDSEVANWEKLYNSATSWGVGAFNRYSSSETDLGWGDYNFITHVVSGDSVQVIKLADETYKKIMIESLAGGIYTFTYANLDGSDEVTMEIDKANYSGKNFVYYSIETGEILDREPLSSEWDITFTRFIDDYNGTPYAVAGVMHNHFVEVSEVGETDVTIAEPGEFSAAINTIGFDWKTFDFTEGWLLTEDLSYFVKTENGDTYQIVFTGFGGSGTGVYEMGISFYGVLSSNDVDPTAGLSIFPNPSTTGSFQIEGIEGNTNIQLIDQTGRVVRSIESANRTERVSTDGLASGIYFVRVNQDAQTTTYKIIING